MHFIPTFRRFFALTTATVFIALTGNAVAQTAGETGLRGPDGQVILTISGQIAETTSAGVAEFDLEGLKRLGMTDVVTETPWTEGMVRFSGVLARDVLDLVGAKGNAVSAVALNDFSVTIPIEDLETYNVIIAMQRDGSPMRVRDRGPLWVIYPWSDNAVLRNKVYYARSIWQLRSLTVVD